MSHLPVSRRRAVAALVGALVGAGCLLAGASCGGSGSAGNAGRFCGEVSAEIDALTSPVLETQDDIDDLVALYERLGSYAPLSIENDWDALTDLYMTASTLDRDDRRALETLKEQSFATERSAATVHEWLRQTCDVDLGPITTIVDHDVRVPTSSVPGDSSAEAPD